MAGSKKIKTKIINAIFEGSVFASIGAGIFLGKFGCEYLSENAEWKYVIELEGGGNFKVKEPVYEGPFPKIFSFTKKPKAKELEGILRGDSNSNYLIFKIKEDGGVDSLFVLYHPIECPWGKWCGYYSTNGEIHFLGEEGLAQTLRHELYHKFQSHGQTPEEFSRSVDVAGELLVDYLNGRLGLDEKAIFEDFWLSYFSSLPDTRVYTIEEAGRIGEKLKRMRKEMPLDSMLKKLDGREYDFLLYVIELEANSFSGDFGLSSTTF